MILGRNLFISIGLVTALLCVLTLATPGLGAATAPAPTDSVAIDSLLLRISTAVERVSYSGVQQRGFNHKGQRLEMQWQEYHWGPDRTVVTFLAPADLRNATFALKGDEIKQLMTGEAESKSKYRRHSVRLLKDGQVFKEIGLLHQNYRVDVASGPRAFGRPTFALRATPRFTGRPRLEVLVDAETGLLLESTRSPGGVVGDSLAETSRFLEISYKKPNTDIFERAWTEAEPTSKDSKAKIYPDLDALLSEYASEILVPENLPDGFSLMRIRVLERESGTFLHFHYSDGLTVISLFQHEFDKGHDTERSKKGHRGGSFVMIRGTLGSSHYSIAGEIPQPELTAIAESLAPISRGGPAWRKVAIYSTIALILMSLFSFARRRREKSYA